MFRLLFKFFLVFQCLGDDAAANADDDSTTATTNRLTHLSVGGDDDVVSFAGRSEGVG